MHKKWIKFTQFLVSFLLLLGSGLSQAVIHSDKIYPIYDDVVLDPTTKFYYYDKPKISVKVTYPKILSETEDENIDQFNQLVMDFIKDERNEFRKAVREYLKASDHQAYENERSTLNIDFNAAAVNGDGNPILSVRFSIQSFVPGTRYPKNYHRTFTYDLYNGAQLELADFFNPETDYLAVIAENSTSRLKRELKYQPVIQEGTEPNAKNYQNWNITPYGLLITFDSMQISPQVYGTQTVFIPYTKLKDVLSGDTAISECRKHWRHCIKNKMLTYGFREQA